MTSVERATIVLQNNALEDQSGSKDKGLRDMRGTSKDRKEMEQKLKEKQDELKELEAELARITEEADDAWSKIKGMFGDDNGMADTTE